MVFLAKLAVVFLGLLAVAVSFGQREEETLSIAFSSLYAAVSPLVSAAAAAVARGVAPGTAPLGARRSSPPSTGAVDYVRVRQFSSYSCSNKTSSNEFFLVQNICMPQQDLSTSPPKLVGYDVWTATSSAVVQNIYSVNDPLCKGPSTPHAMTKDQCQPAGVSLSFQFNTGSVPTASVFSGLHGLYNLAYNSAAACKSNDISGLIAVSPFGPTLPLPASFFGKEIKITCASPTAVEVLTLKPPGAAPLVTQLGDCTQFAPGGYFTALRCLP